MSNSTHFGRRSYSVEEASSKRTSSHDNHGYGDSEDGGSSRPDGKGKGKAGNSSRRRHRPRLMSYIRFKRGGKKPKEEEKEVEVYSVDEFLNMKEEKPWTVDKIKQTITAEKLCEKPTNEKEDHIERIFKVNKKLKRLAKKTTENTEFLQDLAEKVEDFAVALLDQVHTKEEAYLKDEDGENDRYGSLFSGITKKAIIFGQKKFVAHPFLFKRVKMRWQRKSPFDSVGKLRTFLWLLLVALETILTPVLLPFIGYVNCKDQKKIKKKIQKLKQEQVGKDAPGVRDETKGRPQESSRGEDGSRDIFERYFDYINTPLVIFIKTEFMKVLFIGLHCRICVLASSVLPIIEEYLVFLFFMALILSEIEQWRTSEREVRYKIYFRDMWNWIDLLTMFVYLVILILRVVVIILGGDPFENRLLEIAHYCYGFNTMFLVLRFSSLLELSSIFGPLQLALFRMVVDLMTILVQFFFVVVAFSVALAKVYSAEMSYLLPRGPINNQIENNMTRYTPYCVQGAFICIYKAARQLVWSVFGIMEETDLQSHTTWTSEIVGVLYLIFMILSVIMLVNILVALLTNTYEKYRTNWEVEWRFGLAVMEEQYARRHAIIIPYNLFTYFIGRFYFAKNKDARQEYFDHREKEYERWFRKEFIPTTTNRYKERYNGSFPLSVHEKLDELDRKIRGIEGRPIQEVKAPGDAEVTTTEEKRNAAQNNRKSVSFDEPEENNKADAKENREETSF